jgi:hypothetical protein
MSRATKILAVVTLAAPLAVSLAGCGSDDLSRTFGITRDVPDEFVVTTRAPLSMPPDFNLRPPRPGERRPQEQTASEAAESTLAPQTALDNTVAGDSQGQQALIAAAGGPAPADTRQKVEQEAALDAPHPSLTDRLMFWRKDPPAGVVVDPVAESQRLRQNAALGQSVETGDTPIIQRKTTSSGFLGGIL